MVHKTVRTLAEFEAEAARFIGALASSGKGATLVTLSGELGAGKTAFVQAAARSLGIKEVVTSPTFVLEKIYKLGHPTSKFKNLVHIDTYRLSSGSELAALGFDELMRDAGNLVLLEWPEKVADALHTTAAPAVRVSLVANSDNSRDIAYA